MKDDTAKAALPIGFGKDAEELGNSGDALLRDGGESVHAPLIRDEDLSRIVESECR